MPKTQGSRVYSAGIGLATNHLIKLTFTFFEHHRCRLIIGRDANQGCTLFTTSWKWIYSQSLPCRSYVIGLSKNKHAQKGVTVGIIDLFGETDDQVLS